MTTLSRRPGYLLALADHLAPGDVTLIDEVHLAVSDPEGYLAQFRDRLTARGIERVIPDLPLIALVDGLEARSRLREVDWREAPEDVMWKIDQMLPEQLRDAKLWAWVDMDRWEDGPTHDFLTAAAKHFTKRGYVLAYLSIGSDSYPLILIEAQHVGELRDLALLAGYGRLEAGFPTW